MNYRARTLLIVQRQFRLLRIWIKYMFCSLSDQLVMLDTIFRINVAG
jgi:hypothetical protein